LLAEHGRRLGALDVALYLVDLEQETLRPVPNPDGKGRQPAEIDTTLAGRCFQRIEVQHGEAAEGRVRVWVPVVDGTERLGVLEVVIASSGEEVQQSSLEALASVAAEFVMTKNLYGDLFETVRRTRPLTQAAELLWRLLPPLTFANEHVVIAATLAPPYDIGGDAFDYAVDHTTAHFAVFDAMGHGLQSGVLATIALAVYRNSRRRHMALDETAAAIDHAIAEQYTDSSYATGVLAELDLASGRLRYCIAGHPRPLLLRNGHVVKKLDGDGKGRPLGLRLGGATWAVTQEILEPHDRVILFTDGVVDARNPDGEFFGDVRLADFIVRASGTGAPPPETLRRLLRSFLQRQHGQLQDDATVVMMEWHGSGASHMTV
jgi:serine/threonine protein phosphatase PrpC